MSSQSGLSRICVKYGINLTYKDLPASVVDKTKKLILDWLGVAIAGSATQQAQIVRNVLKEMGGTCQAQVIGERETKSILAATMANAYTGHILEFDDVDKKSVTHPGTVVIPAALAVGEWQGKTGEEVLAAIVAGYDVMLRVGEAVMPSHYKIWHNTATTGVFGSVIAASNLLGLEEEAALWAFGNAGTMAAGLWEFLSDGAMTKYLHAGKAAYNGVLASLFAREGLTGATRILEGSKGFFTAYSKETIREEIFKDFNKDYRIEQVSFKPYPCCRHVHGAIDAAKEIYSNSLYSSELIQEVLVETYRSVLDVAGKVNACTVRDAQFSLPYCVAKVLLKGSISINDFTEGALGQSEVLSLMSKTRIKVSPELDAQYPRHWRTRMTVKLKNGLELNSTILSPKGDPENPLSWEEVILKFKDLTQGVLPDHVIDKLVDQCRNFESLENCGELLQGVNQSGKF